MKDASVKFRLDSPGTFAGMVKKENIRFTHFSRNPKIAAFLKDYQFVKEYGEGVDRMCRDLEAIGLPNPTYNNSTFILKATVMSAAFEPKTARSEEPKESDRAPKNESESENARIEQIGESERNSGESDKQGSQNQSLTNVQKQLLELLSNTPTLSADQLATQIRISRRNIEVNIRKLKVLGLLCRSGGKRYGKWIVQSKASQNSKASNDALNDALETEEKQR